ncbi:MAG: hypothetical protein WBE72_08705 [Terracidiphilus sp.]
MKKKQLTCATCRYTFKRAIHKWQAALCDFARPSANSCIQLERGLWSRFPGGSLDPPEMGMSGVWIPAQEKYVCDCGWPVSQRATLHEQFELRTLGMRLRVELERLRKQPMASLSCCTGGAK